MPILIKIPINHGTDMPEHRYVHKCYKMLYYLDSVGKQTGHLKSSKFFRTNGVQLGYIWDQQEIANENHF